MLKLKSLIAAMLCVTATAACAQTQTSAVADAAAPAPSEAEVLQSLQARALQGEVTGPLFWSTAERRVAFKNLDKILPARKLAKGANVYPLDSAPTDLSDVTYEVEGKTHKVGDLLQHPSMIGLAVSHNNKLLLEHYAPGNDASSVWVSFSVSKSVTSMLIGAAIADGYIESVDEPVAHYLPRLRGTPYEEATIKDVLNMASGIAWNEDYADPNSDVANAGGLNGIELVNYLAKLPLEAEPGTRFNYNTGETNLVGEILRSAIGNNASTYLMRKIWQPFGMEYDAWWAMDAPFGAELGGCCISATLRDYVRLGIFAMQGGQLADGTQVLPEGFMADSTGPSQGANFYGYLWWLFGDRGYAAQGIFGQMIRVFPEDNLVIAVHSNADAAVDTPYHQHYGAAVEAIRDAVISAQ